MDRDNSYGIPNRQSYEEAELRQLRRTVIFVNLAFIAGAPLNGDVAIWLKDTQEALARREEKKDDNDPPKPPRRPNARIGHVALGGGLGT